MQPLALSRKLPSDGLPIALGILLGSLAVYPGSRWGALFLATACAVVAFVWWVLRHPSRWVLTFLIAVLLLPPLPLPWGDSGVHIGPAIAALGLCSGVLRLARWRLRFNLLTTALVGLVLALLASVPAAFVNSGIPVAVGSLARVGLLSLSVYLFCDLACGPARRIPAERIVRCLFWAGSASALFAATDFLFQFPAPARFAEQFVWLSSGVFRRAQGVFYEASTLGCLCAFLLVMVAAIAVTGVRARLGIRPLWLWCAAIAVVSAMIFSFSRAAIINVLVSLGVLVVLERRRFRFSLRTLWLPVAACVSAAAGLALTGALFPEFFTAYVMKLSHSAEFLSSEPDIVLSQRLQSWSLLANYIGESPWQFALGIGYKTLPYSDYLGQPVVADNMYLSMLIETGWPGILALLGLSAAVLLQSYREARHAVSPVRRFCGVWMFSFWCGEMVQMLSGDILTYWRILPAFFAVLAIGSRDDRLDSGSVL